MSILNYYLIKNTIYKLYYTLSYFLKIKLVYVFSLLGKKKRTTQSKMS